MPNEGQFGALAFIYGTLLGSFIALVLAVPVSLGIALFTNRGSRPRRFRKPVVYVIDLLAAIPSVVYGLWGIVVLRAVRSRPSIQNDRRRDGAASRSSGRDLRRTGAAARAS